MILVYCLIDNYLSYGAFRLPVLAASLAPCLPLSVFLALDARILIAG
jgi:hypothetical protein